MIDKYRSFLRALTLALVVVLVGTATANAQASDPVLGSTAIHAVRYHVEPGRTRVWFETSGMVLYTQYSPDPLTLVIDLPGVDISGIAETTVIGSQEVESVLASRLQASNGKSLSRIEIKLASLVPYQISTSANALTVVFDGTSEGDGESVPSAGEVKSKTLADGEAVEAAGLEMPETVVEDETPVAVVEDQQIQPVPEERVEPAEPGEVTAVDLPDREPAPSEPARVYPPASMVEEVSYSLSDTVLTVAVQADGRLNYSSFRLDGPKRLVFDFNGVINGVEQAVVPVGAVGVQRMRIAQFRSASPRITRLVFDLDEDVAHRAAEKGDSLEIYFAPDEDTLPVARRATVAEASRTPVVEEMSDDGLDGSATVTSLAAPQSGVQELGAEPPSGLDMARQVSSSLEPVALVASYNSESTALSVGEMASLPEPPQEPAPGQSILPPTFEPQTIGTEERVYSGELISLDFKDGDIQDIFRLFADISGLNIVVQPGVTGRITLKLQEVPWDQALELILKTHKLGYVVEGNVIRIAPFAELANEEAEKRRLAEEKALSGELATMTQQLSYAKADDVQVLLQKNLSPRGDIVIDERTNTLIVTDLPEQIEAINALIATLDTPIPGVEIEARIVVTTRSFSRQFGIQWGFTGHMDQAFGNATELTFPNNILLDGQSLGSDVVEEFKGPSGGGGLLSPQIGADEAQRGYAVNLPMPGFPTGAIGLSLGSITGAFGIDAALTAAETRGQVRILSAPKIITQNNQAATIKQGVTFPVQTVANNTVTVTFKDAVLELQVTPQITSANTIILDMQVNNDVVDESITVNGVPSIQTQEATTQVLVADGSTTVIGGVFVNQTTKTDRYVPLLHRIPVLGWLFKSSDAEDTNRELLIFITPRIRKGPALGG